MKTEKPEDSSDFEELRRLLLGEDLEKLEQLHTHVEIPDNFSSQVGEILPQAMIKSSAQGGALSEALVPTVEEIVRLSIRKDINRFADALFPVIGPAIRKAIRETIRQMLQSLNQTLEHSLSLHGMKWRLESIRTGIPFAQIALLHALVYRVEQVFLIHRETGLLLCHLQIDDIQQKSPDLVSSMLAAINDFVGDSFAVEANRTLDSIEVGELSIWIEPGPDAILALAIRGEAPTSLRSAMQETLEDIQHAHGEALLQFEGDTGYFESRSEILEPCVQSQYQGRSKGVSTRSLLLGLLLLLLGGWWIAGKIHHSTLQTDYVERLRSEPGYVITLVDTDDGKLLISGLRDPLAHAPSTLEFPAQLEAVEAILDLRPYQSLEVEFVERRARQALRPPAEVSLALIDRQLVISGVSDFEWRQQMLRSLPLIAGVEGVDTSGLRARFSTEMLRAPAGVTITLEDGVLYIEGIADQDWIDSLAGLVDRYPEITSIDLRALVNHTEVALVNEIAALEKEIVLFDVATSFDFETFDDGQVTRLVRSIIDGAGKLSRNVLIIVKGYSDSVGSYDDNAFLSRQRAEFVARAIINTGINPRYIAIKGLEAPVKAENSDEERRFNRRVDFDVVVE